MELPDITMKLLLLGTKPYQFSDSSTGRINEGCPLYYLMADDLKACLSDDGLRGLIPAKTNLPFELESKLRVLPGIYAVKFAYSVSSKNQVVMKPKDVHFISEVSIKPVDNIDVDVSSYFDEFKKK